MNTGLQAVSYKDKVIGYPFYFETSSLLYNKTYLEDMARAQLTAEADLLAARRLSRTWRRTARRGRGSSRQGTGRSAGGVRGNAQAD